MISEVWRSNQWEQTCELFGLSDLTKHGLQLNGRWPGCVLTTPSCCLDSNFVRNCIIRNCSCFSSYQLLIRLCLAPLPRVASPTTRQSKTHEDPQVAKTVKIRHADIPIFSGFSRDLLEAPPSLPTCWLDPLPTLTSIIFGIKKC